MFVVMEFSGLSFFILYMVLPWSVLVFIWIAVKRFVDRENGKTVVRLSHHWITYFSSLLLVLGILNVISHFEEESLVRGVVPTPLVVDAIEYRLEKSWGLSGFAMPGDNETGFIVYRLTPESADWAREQGNRLASSLPGGSSTWHQTPVSDDQTGRWHPYDHDPQMMSMKRPPVHPPTIQEYLEKYGFTIPIEKGKDAEADQAIQMEGSFYSYGRGGSVTIVDPRKGKVYHAYAG